MFRNVRVFDLEQPRTEAMPVHPSHQPGYSYLLHRHHQDTYDLEHSGPRTSASGMLVCMEHTGTHIDALCHQSDALTLYGGVPVDSAVQTPKGFTRHGVEEIAPIVAPGVLLDVPGALGAEELDPSYAITVEDLQLCCKQQEVEVRDGEVALVRTGNARNWERPERYLAGAGVSTGASRWFAERRVLAVGADNMAWDVVGYTDPDLGCQLPGHLILLAQSGIYIVENLNMEEIAAAGEHRFLFVCTPLKLVGATGSPVRPVGIVAEELRR